MHRQTPDAPALNAVPTATHRLRLILFGRPRLETIDDLGQAASIIGPGKPLALIGYLALSPGRRASRERLCDLLWGDKQIDSARASLRQAIWSLRRDIGEHLTRASRHGVTLHPDLPSDVAEFEAAIDAKDFEQALALYKGDLFADYGALGAERFEAWAALEGVRLRSMALSALETLTRRALNAGRFREGLNHATRYRSIDSHAEAGWRLMIEVHVASGDHARARAEADYFEEWLRTEGRTPEPASAAVLRTVRRRPPDERSAEDELVGELVDRERQFTTIQEEWRIARGGSARWVHISAATGLGKTRLINDSAARIKAARDRVIVVRAHPGERTVPLTLAATLASRLAPLGGASGISTGAADILTALDPRLGAAWTGARAPAQLDSRGVALALLELISAVAEDRPLAIFIDDLHWTDVESRAVLAVIGARLDGVAVLIVTAARPRYSIPPLPEGVVHLELHPLSEGAVEQCLGSMAALPAAEWTREFVAALTRGSAGNPLAMMETLRLCLDEGTLVRANGEWRCPSPSQLLDSITPTALDRRIDSLDQPATRIIEVLAIAGVPLTRSVATSASMLPEDEASATATRLEERGFVISRDDQWMLAHDSVEESVLESLSGEAIRTIHRRLGRALAAEGGLGRGAVRHLAAGEDWATIARLLTGGLRKRSAFRAGINTEIAATLGDAASPAAIAHVRRELPLAIRLRSRRLIGAASLMIVGALAMVPLMLSRAQQDGADVVLVAAMIDGSGHARVRAIPLDRERWDATRPIVVAGGVTATGWRRSTLTDMPVPRPRSESWAIAIASADTGEGDVALLDRAGQLRRVTWQRGIDRPGSFSPDGSRLAILMTRGHPQRWSRVAVLDLATLQITPLTDADGTEETPQWSPDGTRIGFIRDQRDGTAPLVCTIEVDGSREQCHRVQQGRVHVIGWLGPLRMLLRATTGEGRPAQLTAFDPVSGREMAVGSTPGAGVHVVDPSGRWVLERGDPMGVNRWRVFPADRPDLAREIVGPEGAVLDVRIASPGDVDHQIHTLAILARSDTLAARVPHRLAAAGRNGRGRRVGVPTTFWSVVAGAAAIDSLGVVIGPASGSATIELSAGGWRTARRSIHFAEVPVLELASERWEGAAMERWVAFGVPRPEIVETPAGPAFHVNGDESYHSGAYSRSAFRVDDGLAVDFVASTPLTSTQWQILHVVIAQLRDEAALRRWDHDTGYFGEYVRSSCAFTFPEGEGPGAAERVSWLPYLRTAMSDPGLTLSDGKWYRVRLQLFPDGRCGLAINGRALRITHGFGAAPESVRLVIEGHSHGTRMLVGGLSVRRGIPSDVDWLALEFDGTSWWRRTR